MKYVWPQMVWFCAGAILGQITESVLFPVWAKLGLLMPVGHWIASFGYVILDRCWLLVYIWSLSWLIVALVSVLGGILIKRHHLLKMALFGAGFAFVPLIIWAYINSSFPILADYLQHIVIVGVAVLGGLLGHMWNSSVRRTSQPGSTGVIGN